MEEYLIGRWDQDSTAAAGPDGRVSDMYVPAEVEALARQVAGHYDMQVHEMRLITAKPDKGGAIWRIDTDKGPRSLKVLHRNPARSLFSIGAQQYLVEQGAKVPALIPAKDNKLYVEAGGKAWIVTDWIETLQPVSKVDLEGASTLCYGLGEFHRYSKGYVPPAGALVSSRVHDWPEYYDKIIEKIGWFRHIAEVYPETAASPLLLSVIEQFDRQARESMQQLKQSAYPKMASMGDRYWGLVHQDYGWSNGQMGPGGIWVIDLDGVAYDVPIRDLRKLITSTMDDMGAWDIHWIRGMIGAYHEANPMDRETFELLLNDMAFPNEFYKHVKEMVYDPITSLNSEILPVLQRVMATEESKWAALGELAADKDNYSPGDYTVAPEFDSFDRWRYDIMEGKIPVPAVQRPLEVIEGPGMPVQEPLAAERSIAEAAPITSDVPAASMISEAAVLPAASGVHAAPGAAQMVSEALAPTGTDSVSAVVPSPAARRRGRRRKSLKFGKKRLGKSTRLKKNSGKRRALPLKVIPLKKRKARSAIGTNLKKRAKSVKKRTAAKKTA
jgi:CotS family spore coat protein